jgi:FAD/FMN-containing dehydrogenase
MAKSERTVWQNWAGNHRSVAAAVTSPTTTAQVADAVRAASAQGQTVKPVGTGHSFTAAAATSGVRLDLSGLSGLVNVDHESRLIRVRAGTTLTTINTELAGHGLAMPNLGDIDVQTISGALATGTHGTGAGYGCLSTFVTELELVTGTGEVLRCSREATPDIFMAALVGVGAIGVVTEITIRCVDAFILHADERPTPIGDVLSSLD